MGQILWASTETRPYAFWIFISELHLFAILFSFEIRGKQGKIPSIDYFILSIISFCLMFTASPGFIQVFVILFLLIQFRTYKYYIKPTNIPGTFILPIGVGFSIYSALNAIDAKYALYRWSA
jgi:hypothetical protein